MGAEPRPRRRSRSHAGGSGNRPGERKLGDAVKVDALKIKEIARKLGVSERTVEEYLLDRLTMQEDEDVLGAPIGEMTGRPGVVDRFGRPVDEEAG